MLNNIVKDSELYDHTYVYDQLTLLKLDSKVINLVMDLVLQTRTQARSQGSKLALETVKKGKDI